MKFSSLIHNFFGLLYPKLCEACGNTLNTHEHVFCLSCNYHLPRTGYWNEADNPIEKIFWGRVQVERACALFFFGKGSRYRKLLHKLKYNGNKEIGIELGRQLGNELKKAPLYQSINAIVPVPLHPNKQRKRGYNQSEQIAIGIGEATGWDVNTKALLRNTFTESQTRKSRMERWDNVSEVFALKTPEVLQGKHVLLVDDVLTTGATLEACIVQLQKAEGCKVSVATLACTK